MKNCKKILSAVFVLTLAGIFFAGMVVNAAGTTEEIFNVNFEDGVAIPSINYGGQAYDFSSFQIGTSGATGSITTAQGIYGADADDTCIKVNSEANVSITNYSRYVIRTPDLGTVLKDIGGGKMLISWRIAAPADANYPMGQLYLNSTDGNGDYKVQVIYFALQTTNNRMQFGTQWFDNQWTGETWHKFTAEFTYGSNEVKLYKNGALVTTIQSFASGYTFSGLGTSNGCSMMFGVQHQAAAASNDVYAYYDDISLTTYNSDESYYEPFNETFSSAQLNSVPGVYLSTAGSSANFTPVTGVFGKASSDKSMNVAKSDSATSGSKDVFYQRQALMGGDFQYGGVAHFGVNIALDGNTRDMYKYLNFTSASGSTTGTYSSPGEFMKLRYGELAIFSTSIPVNWQTEKWYNFDIYIYPGNGVDIKNKMTVYMNGKLMVSNLEFDAISGTPYSQFTGINRIRLGQREWLVNDNGTDYNKQLYFDDISFEYYPSGITCTVPEIIVEAADGVTDLCVVDTDTVLLYSLLTAGDIVSRLDVTGADVVKVVSDAMTEADPIASADGCYLKLQTSENVTYLLPITTKIHRYTEDFNDYPVIENAVYNYWSDLNLTSGNGTGGTKGLYGLSGKGGTDQSYVYTNGSTPLETSVYSWSNMMYDTKPWNVEGKATIEFAYLINDDSNGTSAFNFEYHYKTPSETIVTSGITTAVAFRHTKEMFAFSNMGYGYEKSLGTCKKNQWVKIAVVLDTVNFTGDIYVDGVLKQEDIDFLPSLTDKTGYEITDIWRFKIDYRSSNTMENSYAAIDDIDLYVGNYFNTDDIVNVTSEDYTVSNTEKYILIPSDQSLSVFDTAVDMANAKSYTVYDDEDLITTVYADDFDTVLHNSYLAILTPSGAVNYYRIINSQTDTNIGPQVITLQDTEVNASDPLELGVYTMTVPYDKFNSNSENIKVILAVYDGPKLVDVQITDAQMQFGEHSTSVDIEVADAGLVLKGMVWNNSLAPLLSSLICGSN